VVALEMGKEMSDDTLLPEERALVLKFLRESRALLKHRIEQQRSQVRRGVDNKELIRLEHELMLLLGAIRKLWKRALL
jgi:hypothetical protein